MRKLAMTLGLLCFCHFTYANLPYYPLTFPRDEAAHYKNVPYPYVLLVEWWYFNGSLTTDEGRHFSYDIAMFNPALQFNGVITKPKLHIQLSDLDNKKSYGAAVDYAPNAGQFAADKLDIQMNNDYTLRKTTLNGKDVYILKAEGKSGETTLKFDLLLEPVSQPLLINGNGLMPMPNDTNSYYYSIPHFTTTGSFTLNETTYQLHKTPGDSWMDHQWGDFNVQANGWEWFSIRLQNGLAANIFLNIDYKNNKVIDGLANLILPSGEKRFIPYKNFIVTRDNYWLDTKLSMNFPLVFNFNFPELGLTINNVAAYPEQEVHGYWEGYCEVSALYNKHEAKGYSYTEIVYRNPTMKVGYPTKDFIQDALSHASL